MKRVLSGIKPSGEVTLGNYLGAMRRWAAEQDGQENFYFVPNLHALTVRPDPKELRKNTLSAVAWLLAMGVDPARSAIYVQSQIPANSELSWILSNFVTMGELNRMTEFKDKSSKLGAEGQLAGLFSYPVLMAADILLYDADEVPVGEDQKQHVELTRDIATRFNNLYGSTFKIPVPTIQSGAARIMDLQHPDRKMSKSDLDNGGCIMMVDEVDLIRQKIIRSVTDSGSAIEASDEKPAISNLLAIFSELSGKSVQEIEQSYAGRGYSDFKDDLADLAVKVIEPLQQRHAELMADHTQLEAVLEQGRAKAGPIAEAKLAQVKAKLGLI